MTRFFVRPDQIAHGIVQLEADDAHHLRVVLHAQPGEKIAILDGSGREWPAVLTELGKTKAAAQLREPFEPKTEPPVHITVAQALPKVGDKMEQVLQRGTEVGASGFWAFASERSLTQLMGERHEKRLTRWAAIIKTAAEQSHRAKLPSLTVSGDLRDVLATVRECDLALFAYEGEAQTMLASALAKQPQPPGRVLVIIGPEAGFSDGEVKAAAKAGAVSVSLGPRILRTETAALVVVAQIIFAREQADTVR